jgi:hypothetical protein
MNDDMISKIEHTMTNCWQYGCEGKYRLEFNALETEPADEIVAGTVFVTRKWQQD